MSRLTEGGSLFLRPRAASVSTNCCICLTLGGSL